MKKIPDELMNYAMLDEWDTTSDKLIEIEVRIPELNDMELQALKGRVDNEIMMRNKGKAQ